MDHLTQEDIQLMAMHSDLKEQVANKALVENVYNNKAAWQQFIRLLFISLGIGFSVAGIVFFFAYNWANLHKFAKIGSIEVILIASSILALLPQINPTVKKVLLTGSSVLVGVLFAVFGQIYQTGANAYDFFLAWTVFISLWVAFSNFAPLWLLYLVLINTTFILYSMQVANHWSDLTVLTILFIFNAAVLIAARWFKQAWPNWLLNTIALAAVSYATIGMVMGIIAPHQQTFAVLIAITSLAYSLGTWYALQNKSVFYLSLIPFSFIIIIAALLLKISNNEMMFFFIGLLVIGSVTILVNYLLNLQRRWTNEN